MLEQSAHELDFLKGGLVKDVREITDEWDTFIEIEVWCSTTQHGNDGSKGRIAVLHVLSDIEGNGPGYLALMEIR